MLAKITARAHRGVPLRPTVRPEQRLPQHALTAACACAIAAIAGCSLEPASTKDERARLDSAGVVFERPIASRALPDLPAEPTWRDVLHRAFLANGDVEAAYFDWKASLERVTIASAYPNSNLSLGYEYMFSSERMNAFNRSTFSAGLDPVMSLTLPIKAEQAGRVALDEARAAGEKFRVAKFELQKKVLQSWADYVLQDRLIALASEDVVLRRMLSDSTARGAAAGMRVRRAAAADIELQRAESMLLDQRSEHAATLAMLNSLMARELRAPLPVPSKTEPTRQLPDDDLVMLKAAAEVYPEVAVMTREAEGRSDALELARMRWIPDIGLSASFTGSISQALGAMLSVPTNVASIRGGIREAEAQLRASQATLRQRTSDRVGEYVSLLVVYRNAQRRAAIFEDAILPAAERLSGDDERAYESGAAPFAEVLESHEMLLDVHSVIASSRADMEKAIAEIECCLGADIETLTSTQGTLATHPTSAYGANLVAHEPGAPTPTEQAAMNGEEIAHVH